MEYDSAMKTNIIVDTTLVNLEVKIKQAKENTHTHKAKNKSQQAIHCTIPCIQYSQVVNVKR